MFHGLLSLLSDSTQTHQPKTSIIHSEVGFPITVVDQENAPTYFSPRQFDKELSSDEVPSSQITLACVKLTLPLASLKCRLSASPMMPYLDYLIQGSGDVMENGLSKNTNPQIRRNQTKIVFFWIRVDHSTIKITVAVVSTNSI